VGRWLVWPRVLASALNGREASQPSPKSKPKMLTPANTCAEGSPRAEG
jgi:hypothetical protein